MKNLFFVLTIILFFNFKVVNAETIHPLDGMRILEKLPKNEYGSYEPIEQRGIEYRKYLSASVKIKVKNGCGSGTIIYYDEEKNLAYVASCGHLWNKGVLNLNDKKIDRDCEIVTWYKNKDKLKEPLSFNGKVLFYSYTDTVDTSLIVFSPIDWKPNYFSLAPINYKYKIGSEAHSCGCDGGNEVAHYSVKILGLNDDLVTIKNSPRPGRSGGGLIDDNELYIGTCWGTQYIDGSGKGYFTPIKDIHEFWSKQKQYNFLLSKKTILGKKIPIKDKSSNEKRYSPSYILAP